MFTYSNKIKIPLFYLLFLLLQYVYIIKGDVAPLGSIPLKVVNRAHQPLDLFWVNTYENNELIPQLSAPLRNNSGTNINSYATHEFVIRYHDQTYSKSISRFEKGYEEETITVYSKPDTKELFVLQSTKISDLTDSVNETTQKCKELFNTKDKEFDTCVADGIIKQITDISSDMHELKKYRDKMALKLRNYTCADLEIENTTPLSVENITVRGREDIEVETLLDLDASKIWVAHNFVSDEECDILMNHGKPLLKRATIAAEDGTSIVSNTRKAQQASYNFPTKNQDKDQLWDLYSRVIDFVNIKTDYDLIPDGQEEFAIIQYDPTDEYGSHCDADCAGETYTPRGRVATAVLYCKVADKGGGTSFTKADVFVKPRKGDVTFFAYKGSDGKMDTGFTEHSGCPVIEGEKWVTTAWLRQGVSYHDPWNDYDPSGIPIFYGNNDNNQNEVEVSAT